MLAKQAETFSLRYTEDTSITLRRLSQHPVLRPKTGPQKSFLISAETNELFELLSRISAYAPFTEIAKEPIVVIAEEKCNRDYPQWLGFQKDNEISLYYPAYRNASTLAFTFFHEYAHWLHKQESVLSDGYWGAYLDVYLKENSSLDEETVSFLWESFANDFAWFCTNPTFARLERRVAYDFFVSWLGKTKTWGVQ